MQKGHWIKRVLVATGACVLAMACLACRVADTRRAEFKSDNDGVTIALVIVPIHFVHAEYDRFIKIEKGGTEAASQKIFPDSGGYASTNLYRCNDNVYRLLGYFDSWLVNVTQGTITEGECQDGIQQYLGVFEGGRSTPWKFYVPSERKETKLVAKGG